MFVPHYVRTEDSNKFNKFANLNSINGYIFGNIPIHDVCIGDKIDWYLLGMGNDFHTVHFQAQTVRSLVKTYFFQNHVNFLI